MWLGWLPVTRLVDHVAAYDLRFDRRGVESEQKYIEVLCSLVVALKANPRISSDQPQAYFELVLRGEANQGSDAYRKVLKSLVDSRSISDELPLTALPNRHTDVVRFDAGAADDEFDVGRGEGWRPPSEPFAAHRRRCA